MYVTRFYIVSADDAESLAEDKGTLSESSAFYFEVPTSMLG
jgi:hypothetical protein